MPRGNRKPRNKITFFRHGINTETSNDTEFVDRMQHACYVYGHMRWILSLVEQFRALAREPQGPTTYPWLNTPLDHFAK